MASVVNRPNGHKWVQFKGDNGKRQTLRLGKVSKGFAADVRLNVEHLLSSRIAVVPVPRHVAAWLRDIGAELRGKLARVGLVDTVERQDTLGGLIDFVLSEYEGSAVNTQKNMARVGDALRDILGADRPLSTLTLGDGDHFRRRLTAQLDPKLLPTTVSELCKKAKTLFNFAVRKRWIETNPFAGMGSFVRSNPDRQEFITCETFEKLLEFCDLDLSLILALVRYGGMRFPTDVLALRWEHVDLAGGRISVYAVKTKSWRAFPVFPELRPFLESALDRADNGAEFVAARLTHGAVRSRVEKRLKRAGLDQWPRLFNNLRASRETELMDMFATHIVVAWLGNSPEVAKNHYLQVTDEHFKRGATEFTTRSEPPKKKRSKRRSTNR